MKVKTRFAPSPTGNLHIGGARTALFNYLFARHNNGTFLLRIEDTDIERSKREYVDDILNGLLWLGIDWDEGPYFQRERMEIYKQYAYRLLEKAAAYRCYCPPELIEGKRQIAIKAGKKPIYDRHCRDLRLELTDRPYVIRFKTPLEGEVGFDDLIRGRITFKCDELDDLIILRSDGTPTYNFTVVIDDALMGITHVIRGDDHINNTPRQVLMYEALGFAVPKFAHVPLIHGKDKTRLSKRHGAVSLLEYRDMGLLPEALLNYIARLGWAYKDEEVFSRERLIELFDLSHVGKSPAIFDIDKLLWLNSLYIKAMPEDEIARRLRPYLEVEGIDRFEDEGRLIAIVRTLKERAKTLKEMASMAGFYFHEHIVYDENARQRYLNEETLPVLEAFLEGFKGLKSIKEEEQKGLIEALIKRFNKKAVDIIQPIRVALSGRTASPGIFEVIEILGREVVERRIKEAIEAIRQQGR